MESENAQEEDLTSNTLNQSIASSKDSFDLADESFSKSDFTDSEKDKMPEMFLDPSECGSQLGRVNGKVSDKDEEEDSVDPEQLSQSSTSDDSSGSSDVSSSSSDDEASSNQNRWSSSVTCKGIKLSVRNIRDSNQPNDAPRESDVVKSSDMPFCNEVKSSRLSDDSSSSDSPGASPSRSQYLKSNNSNCNDSNSLENEFVGENLSPNSRHLNLTNYKNSISNFTSHLGAFSVKNSSPEKDSCNISRNDRRSIDSVGSHLSLKSNPDIVFERKLSLSSDSSDSENSCDRLENPSSINTVDSNNDKNLCNDVKSDSSNFNIYRAKPDSNSEGLNTFLDSTCVKFNDVNTVRSPENKSTSPVKENSQGSSSVDRFFDNSIGTQKPVSPEQKLNCIQTPTVKLSDQNENDSTSDILSNSISKRNDVFETKTSIKQLAVHKYIDKTDQVAMKGSENDASNFGAKNSLNHESFLSSSISNSSGSSEAATGLVAKEEQESVSDPIVPEKIKDSNGPTGDLDLDFKSQDMGMEISSDSSLSSDEDSMSQSKNLSDFNFESGNSDKETDELVMDVKAVIGVENHKESDKTEENQVNVMKVIGGNNEEPSKETMADVMNIIGVSRVAESSEPMDVDQTKSDDVDVKDTEESRDDVMKVTGDNIKKASEKEVADVRKIIGVDTPSKELMDDVMNVIGVSNDKPSEESMADVMNIIGVKSEKPSEESVTDVMKIIGLPDKSESTEMDVDIMKVIGCDSLEPNKPNQNLTEAFKSQASMSSMESSIKTVEPKLVEETEDNSVSTNSRHNSSPNDEVPHCNQIESSDSRATCGKNSSSPKSDSKRFSRLYELLDPEKREHKIEVENISSLDTTLPVVSKEFDRSSETETPLTEQLLSNDKEDSIKLNNKSKPLLNSATKNESGQLVIPAPGQRDEKEPPAEYAQFLGLQPTVKFKCCICAQIGFQSYAELREHQTNCQSTEAGKSSTSCERSSLEKSVFYPNADDINQTNFRISRKVYLCAACGTYYENWNLFLHMQEVHQRFICLLCLGMFTMSYKLSDHLILTHGVEVKSFQNLLDFKQAFNCALYVSCTDCGKTFGEADNWSSHHCLFTCNVCNIKNGHLPRCPRNFIFKGDETVNDGKLHSKCIIRINPGSCTTAAILPKRDDKPYDIASSFCSVDLAEEGETVSDSEKIGSPRLTGKSSGEEEVDPNLVAAPEKTNTSSTQENSNKQVDSALLQQDESSNSSSIISNNLDQSHSGHSESEEKRPEALKSPSTADESKSCSEIAFKSDYNDRSQAGNHGDFLCKESNAEEIENRNKTSDLTLKNKTDTQAETFNEVSSVDSREAQKSQILEKRSDMKFVIKKSVLNNPMFKLSSNSGQTSDDLGIDSPNEIDNNKQSRMDSSVFDPDYEVQTKPSRSLTSPVNCEDENQISKSISSNPNNVSKENLDFKNLLNQNGKAQDPSNLGFQGGIQISSKESEKDNGHFEASMESQESVSDDSRMEYESDSQPDPTINSKISIKIGAVNSEENPSSLPSNDTSDSDSNKLSMAVENNEQTMDSKSSMKSNPTDEKMMIDYDGDNAVDNADTVGQGESNYNNFDSDQDSTNSDGIAIASEEVPAVTLTLNGPLESIPLNMIVKECVRVSCTACAYCTHALKIAVHARELVLHLLAEHRYMPSRTDDSPEKVITLLKNGITSLENVFFNTNSYDSSDKASNLPYDGTFSCFQCPFRTLQHKDLYTHKRKMHQKTILLCVMCKSNFYSYSELLCHMCPGTYQPNDILFRCCFCHIDKIPSAFRLMVHIRKIHHTCEICLDVSMDQQKLATHMWKHKLHHLCYRCGIAYRNKPDITRHLFWKHGTESVLCKKCLQKKWPHVYHFCIPPTTVVCDECSATFTRTVALRVHKRLHSNEKPYGCTQCEEKFISKKILEKHEISHTIKEEDNSRIDVAKKENYEPSITKNLLGLTDPPIQIQKTDEKQNIDVDDETVPVIRIKKNKTKKSKPMLDLTDLPPLNLSSESDSEPEPMKPAVPPAETTEVKSEVEVEGKSEMEINNPKEDVPVEMEEKKENLVEITDSQRLEIILADHDYCKPQSEEKECSAESAESKETKPETSIDLNNSLNSTLDTKETSASDSSPTKQKSKSPKKKLNKSSNSSSSSSSSDSDSSSCSCGSNCSCSSSSSSSSTTTSSDSDSSNPENRRKQEERRQKRRERPKTKSPKIEPQPEPIISVENEEPIIMESDLDTDITLTDEDFYDEYPQQHANKMLAEKQQSEKDQLMLLASVAPTHTAPSSPIVSAEETPAPQPSESPRLKKKLKTKRKRDQTLDSASKQYHAPSPFESRFSQLPANPSLITKLPNPNARSYASMSQTPTSEHFSDRTLSTGGSGSESESKRSSKRRRTKNRFYGYSSEEENQAESSKPRFKPKKLKKVVAVRKPEPMVVRMPSYHVSNPVQPPSMSSHQPYQPHQPSITIKPILPPVSEVIRSTLPPFRHRPPSPSSSSDSDDDKLNIDEKFSEPPQMTLPPALAPPQQTVEKNANLYCYCQCPYDEVSEMIACDGDDCRIEWFHFECVGIMVPPKGQWFCPDCRKKKNLSY